MKYCVVLPSVVVATTANEILRCVAKRCLLLLLIMHDAGKILTLCSLSLSLNGICNRTDRKPVISPNVERLIIITLCVITKMSSIRPYDMAKLV